MIPIVTKGSCETLMGSPDPLIAKMHTSKAIKEKSTPVNGFPVSHAKTATESRGKQNNIPSNLLDGSHLNINAASNT
jgi:hypothetical protein